MRNYIFFRAWPNRPAQNPLNGKDPPSRRVFSSKKLYLMKKIITFKLSVQNYCQIHIPASCFALKKVKPTLHVFTPLFFRASLFRKSPKRCLRNAEIDEDNVRKSIRGSSSSRPPSSTRDSRSLFFSASRQDSSSPSRGNNRHIVLLVS